MIIKYLEFPTGNRPYGGGGWSSRAKYRPLPVLIVRTVNKNELAFSGKSVFINGLRKLKLNIYTNKGKIIRQDYPDIGFKTKTI